MRRSVRKFVIAAAAAILLAGGAGTAKADALTLGNSSENIMNGGVLASDTSGRSYYADMEKGGSLYTSNGSKSARVSSDEAENINVIGGYIYYTVSRNTGSVVYRIPVKGGVKTKCFTTNKTIDEMYVDEDGTCYFLAGGSVFTREEGAGSNTASVRDGKIQHFIPTEYGMIIAKGSFRNYTLYAGKTKIRSKVTKFYTYNDYLILSAGGKDYQVRIHDLFHGFTSAAIQSYTLGNEAGAMQAVTAAVHSDDCEICKENAAEAARTGIAAASATAVQAAASSGTKSILNDSSVSDGQRNMVKRARQQHEVKWTAQKTIKAWTGASSAGMTFDEGTTYQGLPYGQPTKSGKYTPWGYSLEDFVSAAADSSSLMYTGRGSNGSYTSPYYSCDCSSFVSWAWNLPSRQWTGSIGGYANVVATQSVYGMEIGDALVLSGSHVVMVSDIGYKDGNIVYVDIMEQTPPKTKWTSWGEGGSKSLAELYTKYFVKRRYKLIRSKTRDDVKYYPSDVVPLDGDGESSDDGSIVLSEKNVELAVGATKTLTYKKDAALNGSVSWSSSDSDIASVNNGTVKAVAGGKATISLKVGNSSGSCAVYVQPAKPKLTSVVTNRYCVVKVRWGAVSGADSYEVYRKSAGSSWELVGTTKTGKFTDDVPGYDKTFTYRVRALYKVDERTVYGEYGNEMSIHTVPDTPKLLALNATSATSQELLWSEVPGADGYQVYILTPTSANWEMIADTKDTKYRAEHLTVGVLYKYTVRAYVNYGGEHLVGYYDPKGIARTCTVPTPRNVTGSSVKYGTITLKWDKVEEADGYVVHRKKNGKWVKIATVKKNTYTDKELTYGQTYTYAVNAYTVVKGEAVLSNYERPGCKVVCKLPSPELKKAVSSKAKQATLTWNTIKGADGYRILCKVSGGKWKVLKNVSSKTSSFTATGLQSNKTYYMSVVAYWNHGSLKYGSYNSKGLAVKVR